MGEFEQIVLLAILRLGEKAYGVTIRAEIAARTDREPAPGALYTTLDRLEEKGFVTSRFGDPTPQRGGRAKRFFKVTESGVAAIARAQRSYQSLLDGLKIPGSHMHSERVAEWILSLVTTPDRAAATVGDLIEGSSGLLRFWTGILGTAASLLRRALSAHPGKIARAVLLVYLAEFVLFDVLGEPASRFFWFQTHWKLYNAAMNMIVALQGGRWLARWARGVEIPAAIAHAAIALTGPWVLYAATKRFHPSFDLVFLLYLILFYCSAIWTRRAFISSSSGRPAL